MRANGRALDGPVGAAVNVPLKWERQGTGAYEGKDIFAAQLQPDSSAEVILSAQDSTWTLVRRTMNGTTENPTGRLVTCEVDLSDGIEPMRLTLRDLTGEYVLRAGKTPTVTWAPRVPNPFAPGAQALPHAAPPGNKPPAWLKTTATRERACQALDALREFEGSPGGKLRDGEANDSLRLRCSAHMKARGFEDNVCFPQTEENPHPTCPTRSRQ